MGERIYVSYSLSPHRHARNWCEHAAEQYNNENEKHDQKHRLLQGIRIIRDNDAQSRYSYNENNG